MSCLCSSHLRIISVRTAGEGASVLVVGLERLRGQRPSPSAGVDEDEVEVVRERAISPLVDGATVHSSRTSRALHPLPHEETVGTARDEEEDEGEEIEREMGRRDVRPFPSSITRSVLICLIGLHRHSAETTTIYCQWRYIILTLSVLPPSSSFRTCYHGHLCVRV